MAVKMRSATSPRTTVSILHSCQSEQLSIKETKEGVRKEQRESKERRDARGRSDLMPTLSQRPRALPVDLHTRNEHDDRRTREHNAQ